MDSAWECKCGSVEYSDFEPEECLSCGKIGSFTQLPSELVEERMKENAEVDLDLDMGEEMPIKEEKSLKGKSKKPKLEKVKRRTKRK